MLHFQINPHTGVPVYRQLMDQIKYYIASGTLVTGCQLPSIRELSRTLAINPTTVVKAYTELEYEKTIEMKHGKGVFVTESKRSMSNTEREKTLRRIARQLVVEAAQMGASATLVLRLAKEELEQTNRQNIGGQEKKV